MRVISERISLFCLGDHRQQQQHQTYLGLTLNQLLADWFQLPIATDEEGKALLSDKPPN